VRSEESAFHRNKAAHTGFPILVLKCHLSSRKTQMPPAPHTDNHCIKLTRQMDVTTCRLTASLGGRVCPPHCPFSGQKAELLRACCQ